MSVTGEWEDLVKSSMGFGGDIGISLTRNLTSGFTMSYSDADPSNGYDPGPSIDISEFQWSLYTYEFFSEYLFLENDLSPFVGGQVGVHFTHIDYVSFDDSVRSMGDHGIGYTLAGGARYRLSQRAGLTLRLGARQTPGLYSGWRTFAHVGLSVFL